MTTRTLGEYSGRQRDLIGAGRPYCDGDHMVPADSSEHCVFIYRFSTFFTWAQELAANCFVTAVDPEQQFSAAERIYARVPLLEEDDAVPCGKWWPGRNRTTERGFSEPAAVTLANPPA